MAKEGLSLIHRISISSILVILSTLHLFDGLAVDGILPLIQEYFSINDSTTGMAKTFSSICATLSLALMLLFGSRFEKRTLILLSMLCYGIFHGISLLSGPDEYWLFVSTRSISTFTSSAFAVLMPVIFADFYSGRSLGRALMLSAFVGMIGSLFSISISSFFVTSSLPWQTSLVIGPTLTIILLPVLFFLYPKPSRRERNVSHSFKIHRFCKLFSIRTYLLIVIGMSVGNFYIKNFMFWMPSFLLSAWNISPQVYGNIVFPMVITSKSMTELMGTLIGLPLLVWVAEQFHFGFRSFPGSTRSIPIVVSSTSLLAAVAALGQIYFASHSYTALLISAFLNSFMGAPLMSLCNQLLLTVCPSDDRSVAMSLLSLITSLVTLPAEQIIGRISDTIRGNSELLEDRFFSLEIVDLIEGFLLFSPLLLLEDLRSVEIRGNSELLEERFFSLKTALFANWTTFISIGLVYSLVVFFYPFDELKVRMKENEEKIEKCPLLT